MKQLFVIIVLSLTLLGMQITKKHDFVGHINTLKVHNGILYIGGESGFLALDQNRQKVFINRDLSSVESIDFVNIDNDDQDEILISSWLSFAILDDDGSTIARNDTFASIVSSAMPISHYMDGKKLKIVYADPGDYDTNSTLKQYSYTSGDEWFDFDWSVELDQYTIPSKGIKATNNAIYSMQIGNGTNLITQHSLVDGNTTKELNSTASLSCFEIDEQNNRLIVGDGNGLSIYKLSDFSLLQTYPISNIKNIKFSGDTIAVVANNENWRGEVTSNEIYILKLTSNGLEQLFYSQTNNKITNAMDFASDGSLYFNAGDTLIKVDGQTYQKTIEQENDNGIYDSYYNDIQAISAIPFGGFNAIIGSLDIYGLDSDSNIERIYLNGLLIKTLSFINIDSDENEEFWVSDEYRTYLFDDNETLLWTLPFRTSMAKTHDLNNDGTNELILLANGSVMGYDKDGNQIFNHQDSILNFDIKDIDNDGLVDIAYISYSDDGDKLKVVDTNSQIKFEKNLDESATNINLFSYVQNPNGGYSVVFNSGSTYRVDINESNTIKYIEGKGFVNDSFKSAILEDIDGDGTLELLRATKDGVYTYEIFPTPTYDEKGLPLDTAPISEFTFATPLNELRGVALFDKDRDGTYEVLLSYDEKLALYSLEGTKIWEYADTVDTNHMEYNHFTHIKTLYASDNNHKIYVSGYSLYEFGKNGNYLSSVKGSSKYMVTSSGSYANPFDINNKGDILLGQMGYYKVDTATQIASHSSILSLKEGWNLISIPVVTTLDHDTLLTKFSNAKHIWYYNSSTNSWGYASTLSEYESLVDSPIISLSQGDGFWIYNLINEDITFDGVRFDITTDNNFSLSSTPWRLWGSGMMHDTSHLCLLNDNVKVIWGYNGTWSAHGCDSNYSDLIRSNMLPNLQTIQSGQGFWSFIK